MSDEAELLFNSFFSISIPETTHDRDNNPQNMKFSFWFEDWRFPPSSFVLMRNKGDFASDSSRIFSSPDIGTQLWPALPLSEAGFFQFAAFLS